MSKMISELKEYILGLCQTTDDACEKDKVAVVADLFSIVHRYDRPDTSELLAVLSDEIRMPTDNAERFDLIECLQEVYSKVTMEYNAIPEIGCLLWQAKGKKTPAEDIAAQIMRVLTNVEGGNFNIFSATISAIQDTYSELSFNKKLYSVLIPQLLYRFTPPEPDELNTILSMLYCDGKIGHCEMGPNEILYQGVCSMTRSFEDGYLYTTSEAVAKECALPDRESKEKGGIVYKVLVPSKYIIGRIEGGYDRPEVVVLPIRAGSDGIKVLSKTKVRTVDEILDSFEEESRKNSSEDRNGKIIYLKGTD